MSNRKIKLVILLRYLWLSIALFVVASLVFDAMSVKKTLIYELDFHQSISRDTAGWYPESRIAQSSFMSIDAVDLVAEPVYFKVYAPNDFSTMSITGSFYTDESLGEQDIRLGIKKEDGSWEFQQISSNDFILNFDLAQARKNKNQFELILSVPSLPSGQKIALINNWQIKFQK
ncbi:hypothetical protein C0580_00480 [Candidatus Parcubacteria bacterium]|nr:MAG: hypothetical protein C0580_00480 [Candidatus Parcubacteria bacterium]